MEFDVIFNEIVDEVEAVIIVLMVGNGDVVAICIESFDQLWPVEFLDELVIGSDIDLTRRQSQVCALGVQHLDAGVISSCLSTAEVGLESLLAEYFTLSGLTNWRKSRETNISLRLLSCTDNSSITSHREASNRSSLRVDVKVFLDYVGKLLGHVCEHVEVLVPWRLCSIAVVSSAISFRHMLASLGAVLIDTSGTGIGEDHSDLALLGCLSITSFSSGVLPSASQT